MEQKGRPESIRLWYERTTSRARKAIFWATGISLVVMVVMWIVSPLVTLQRIQTWNGALTVPLLGGVWILSFIFMFLIPSREASFRGQEALEQMVDLMNETVSKKVDPAVVIWKSLGERIQAELDKGLLDDLKGAVKDLREAAAKVHEGNGEVKKFAQDVKPVVKALQEIHDKMEKGNVLYEIVEGARAIRALGQPIGPPPGKPNGATQKSSAPAPAASQEIDEPKRGKALDMIRKKV